MENIKGVIFDLDGTLFDSLWVWEEVDRRFLGKRGFEVPPDYSLAISAMSYRETAEYTIRRFGLNEQPEQLMREWLDLAREMYAGEVKFKDGAIEFLHALKKRGLKLGIATSSTADLYMPLLKNTDTYPLFSTIMDTSGMRGKDYPDVYLAAARAMGLQPHECVVFEDVETGLKSAKQGGFVTVAIVDKHFSPQMKEIAHFTAATYSQLLELIEAR
ncbi:MAG: HAD family phosphatase [Clostridia bacterium]|nr:HAD family phosphatase [Clostridia bacterium]